MWWSGSFYGKHLSPQIQTSEDQFVNTFCTLWPTAADFVGPDLA
jgi:hypothetical protein